MRWSITWLERSFKRSAPAQVKVSAQRQGLSVNVCLSALCDTTHNGLCLLSIVAAAGHRVRRLWAKKVEQQARAPVPEDFSPQTLKNKHRRCSDASETFACPDPAYLFKI